MAAERHEELPTVTPHCCPCPDHAHGGEVDRRVFLGGAALGGLALSGLSWTALSAAEPELPAPPPRRPLRVKPVFIYGTYKKVHQRSWRPWGGIETQEQADAEVARINKELEKLKADADFPLEFFPLAATKNAKELEACAETASADALLVFASSGSIDPLEKLGKPTIIFVRHRSGPAYLWYEIVSPRFLRRQTDARVVPGIDDADVVVDRMDEVLWRLRSLGGLMNTRGTKIIAIGGPAGWGQKKDRVQGLLKQWGLDVVTLPYPELGKLIESARADGKSIALAEKRTQAYLKLPGTKLETDRKFLVNAFVLEQVFRKVMNENGCRAITISGCMGTIMPYSETTACMPLSTLNDDGFLAFCESDFVVIPAGLLLANISGRPVFLNDPTYPHDGLITLAHCTAPRKMDGKSLDDVRILTHFESDYGAAPKVEMRKGQQVTNIIPDFQGKRWIGLPGEIVEAPFLPICRSQIDIKFTGCSKKLAEHMHGFHWMTGYGDYMRELGYALKHVPIEWEVLG
jgi:hypothetical protein